MFIGYIEQFFFFVVNRNRQATMLLFFFLKEKKTCHKNKRKVDNIEHSNSQFYNYTVSRE
jgi:hypothetical protein